MRVLIIGMFLLALTGCASATSYSFTGSCHNPKMPKAGQDMTSYAEYLLRHIKTRCN